MLLLHYAQQGFHRQGSHPENWIERKGAGVLGPTKADWGQTWPSLALSWAEQEPTWAQLGPGLTCAELGPVGSNLSPGGTQHGPVWGHLPRKLRPREVAAQSCHTSSFVI